MKILRLGHAMYCFTSNSGTKVLVDPFFDMNPGCPPDYQTEEFMKSIQLVALTHGHFDHTSGLHKIVAANPDVLIIAQYELALILLGKGMKNVIPLNVGGQFEYEDLELTMVTARHTSSYGETIGAPMYAGESSGYILDWKNDHTIYHSGDTAMMSDMKLIQEVYKPSIAILAASGHFTMNPKEAAYVVKNLLDVDVVIPSHTFPSEKTASSKETLQSLLTSFPVVEYMIDRDNELQKLLKDYERTRVDILRYGEERVY
ncbi:metal-dependent hydrolase [Bacillus litorisediminis]|uniref:metal-dependent hydrolase n=1 Tax=Bacillus litorisediminis TaxID=2922713 RepID=UPI001FAE4ED5|nr:metal-dependent hydrolase [Bacillus litorisediminis]